MKILSGRTAVVTGAASGIGRELAIAFAKKGCHLALADRDEAGLLETVACVGNTQLNVSTHVVDVADREAIYNFAKEVGEIHQSAHILVNNAGVSLTATVNDLSIEDFEWIMNINFWGVVNGTQAFLPLLSVQDEAHIVNISSLFGIISSPSQSAYNASKFAVRGFSEAFGMELDLAKSPIGLTSVHPGGVKTNIVKNSKIVTKVGMFKSREKAERVVEKYFKTSPQAAAERIIFGILKNKRRILIGKDAVSFDLMQRVFPAIYQKLLIRTNKKGKKKRKNS